MIIRELEIVNILSHRHTRLAFDTGIVAIVGPNGAGKSSIIDAISFALFNVHSRNPRSNKPLVRLGASTAIIRVKFEIGGRVFEVEKRLDATGRTRLAKLDEILEDGKRRTLARDVRTVTVEVGRLLGIRPEVARIAMISYQGELADILEGSRRQDYVNRMLGLEAIEKTYEKLRSIVSEWRIRLEGVKTRLSEKKRLAERRREELESLEGVEEELKRVEAELTQLYAERDKVRDELEHVKSMLEEVRRELHTIEAKRSELESARLNADNLKRQLEALEEELAEYSRYARLEDKLPLLTRLVSLVSEYRGLAERYTELEREAESIAAAEEELREVERRVDELRDVRSRLEDARRKVAQYDAAMNELRYLRGEEARLKRELERIKADIVERASRVLGVSKRVVETEDIEAIEARLTSLEETLQAELEGLEAELEKLRSKTGEYRARLDELGKTLSMLASAAGRCPVCGRPLREDERLRLIRRYRDEKESLRRELVRLEERIRLLEARVKEVKSRLDRLQREKSILLQLTARYRRAKEELSRVQERMRGYEALLRELRVARLELSELEEKSRVLDELEKKLYALREKVAKGRDVKAKLAEVEEKLNTLTREIEELAEDLGLSLEDALELDYTVIEELRAKIEAYKVSLARRDELVKRLEEVEERIRELEEVVAREEELKAKEASLLEHHDKLEARLEELNRRIIDAEGRKAVLLDRLEQKKRIEEELRELQRKIEQLEAEYAKLTRIVSDLERIRRALSRNALPQIIRSVARKLIEAYMREILSAFNLDFIDVKLTEDYDVVLVSNNGERRFRMLSGGEKTAIALAFRMAFARMLTGRSRINTLILDEPTLFLDEQRKRELIRILRSGWHGGGKILPQLIIVTHDREIEEAADQVIEVVKVDGESRVRVVNAFE